MSTRTIKKIVSAKKVNLGGLQVDQALPVRGIDHIDPFLLIHHASFHAPPNVNYKTAGVGPHPHRGFSPVTFIYKGSVHHRDSLGNSEVVNDGGTQWMHAGNGIVHSERPGKDFAKVGGDNEFVQFWVNSPAVNKKDQAYYKPISDENTPKIKSEKVEIAVVAGEYEKVKGPTSTFTPQTLLRVEAKQNASFELNIPIYYNCLFYLLDGELFIAGKKAKQRQLIWFENDADKIAVIANQNTRFVVLSGKPIEEPVASYGPFVMNTNREIKQAMFDYQAGVMGTLNEQFD